MMAAQVVLVGATLTDDQVALAASAGWINDHVAIRVGREDSVPSGLRHRLDPGGGGQGGGRAFIIRVGRVDNVPSGLRHRSDPGRGREKKDEAFTGGEGQCGGVGAGGRGGPRSE